ncbi:MAG: S41 family peptidase [Phycisphaerales bacterium]
MLDQFTRRAARNTTLGVLATLGLLAGSTVASSDVFTQTPETTLVSSSAAVTPGSIWEAAVQGNSGALRSLLDQSRWESIDTSLAFTIERLNKNIDTREQTRDEQIEEAKAELLESLEDFDKTGSGITLSEAMRSVVQLQLLYDNDDELFKDASVNRTVELAKAKAAQAEEDDNWMIASELYFRLNTLFDTSGDFKDDVSRLSRRLSMIRMYAPERLWEIRNQRRLDEDLDPLPPYNAYGDDFHEKLQGINSITVRTAIQRAADQHVGRQTRKHPDGVTMSDLIVSGLDAVKTMATTTDLAEVFDGLKSNRDREDLLRTIESQKLRIASKSTPANVYDLRRALESVLSKATGELGIMEEAVLHEFGNGAMSALDDYTAIIWPDELARFRRSTQGEFIGIGVQIQLDELQNVKIVTPLEGTPAQRAGFRSDDIIKKIDGRTAVGLGLDQAVELITGPANTKVNITVERMGDDGEPFEKDFTIVRQKIDLPSVKGWSKTGPGDDEWDYFIDKQDKIGYLRLTGFTEDSTGEFDEAVSKMKDEGLNALILDLRYNPGGLLDQAVNLASRFVSRGMIVKTVDASGITESLNQAKRVSERSSLSEFPVIVLVNEGSASASEILSGAIQAGAKKGMLDALVLGNRSFGKGSVQNVYLLPGARAAMKVTTNYYQIDAPRMIHKVPGATEWGIEPDLEIDMLPSQQQDALLLRREADVLPLDENGNIIENAERPDPNSLLTEGTDLQVETALVLLKAKVHEQAQKSAMSD